MRIRPLVAALTVALISGAFAQQGPPNGGGNGGGPGGNDGQRPPGNGSQNLPTVDSTKVTEARQAVREAIVSRDKARQTLTQIAMKLDADFKARPDVVDAAAAVQSTKQKYDAATAPILAALAMRADYQQAQAAVFAASTASSENASALELANQKLAARAVVRAMETAALAADSNVQSSHDAYIAAAAANLKLHDEFVQSMHTDPDWLAAKSALDDANAAITTAQANLADANRELADQKSARNAALAAATNQQNNSSWNNNSRRNGSSGGGR